MLTFRNFVALSLYSCSPVLNAALLLHEPFDTNGVYDASGGYANPEGVNPTNALVWDSDTTSGGSIGQAPPVAGFATSGWTQFGGTNQSNSVYPRLQNSQSLSYATGSQQLTTTTGEVSIFRSGGTATSMKAFTRNLDIGPSGGSGATYGSTLYVSGLIHFTGNVVNSVVRSASSQAGGAGARTFGMNITGGGAVELWGGGSGSGSGTSITADGVITTGVTYLFVWKLEDHTVTGNGDVLTLYLNPLNLASEAGNASLVSTPGGEHSTENFFVAGNAAWSLRDLTFGAAVSSVGDEVTFDEFRIGTSWEDVVPHTVIPEPGFAGLAALAACLTGWRRRR